MSTFITITVGVLVGVAAGFYSYGMGRESRGRSWWVRRWPFVVTASAVFAIWVLIKVADHQALTSYCAAREGHMEYVQGVGSICVTGTQT